MGIVKDLSGQKFGRLTAVRLDHLDKDTGNSAYWLFRCDCGNEKVLCGKFVSYGGTKSCGCLQKGQAKQSNTKHGESHTKLNYIWSAIKQRCFNPANRDYANYGARGITVCDEWRNDFISFRDWSYKNGYVEGMTIDRIDNNEGYSPDNCRWTDKIVQNNNRRSNHFVEWRGESRSLADWERVLGIKQRVLWARLNDGWSVERAFTTKAKTV